MAAAAMDEPCSAEKQTNEPLSQLPAEPQRKGRRRTATSSDVPRVRRRKSQTERPSFPSILMGMLSNPQNADIISFLSDERRFIIVNPIALENKVLPLYAEELGETVTFAQFMNLLCQWGFRVTNDTQNYPDVNVYSHPNGFKKGDWDACRNIVEQKKGLWHSPKQPSEETLLQKMEASRASRRLSGVGFNGDNIIMRSFVQNQMNIRRLSDAALSKLPPVEAQQQESKGDAASAMESHHERKKKENSIKNYDNIDQSTTDKLLSDAKAALSNEQMNPTPSYLDVMTEEFLKRSMTRRFGSRPMFSTMIYNNMMAEVGAKVDTQADLLFRQKRRESSLGSQNHLKEDNDDCESKDGFVKPDSRGS